MLKLQKPGALTCMGGCYHWSTYVLLMPSLVKEEANAELVEKLHVELEIS